MLEEIRKKLAELNDAVSAKTAASDEKAAELDGRIRGLSDEITALREKAERGFQVPGHEDEKQEYSYARALKACVTGDWSDAGFEKECHDAIAKTVNADSGAAGGFLSPTQQTNDIIDLAIAKRPILNDSGIDIMSGLSGFGEIKIPKLISRQTAYWTGSEEEVTESNPTFGEVSIRPKYLRGLSVLSREMLKQEPGLVEPIIRREIGNAQALKLEQSLISGTGTDKEPRGIVNYSNVQTESVGTNGGRFKFEHADNMVGSIEDADHNLADGSYGFLFYPKTRRLLRNEQVSMYSGDTDGEYRLGVPIITDALLREVLGYDFYTTTLVPHTLTKGSGTALSNVVFGDWSQIMLAMWGGMEIRTSTEAGDAFTKNQIYIAAYLACDIQVRDETKFCVVSDAATSA